MSLWGGRFTQKSNKFFEKFNKSINVDYKLVKEDIFSSIQWSKALKKIDVLTSEEQKNIEEALKNILKEVETNPKVMFLSKEEDIHSWIEKKLIISLGSLGKKLHTGRSRNDQVTTDLKLWCKRKIKNILNKIYFFKRQLIKVAERNQKSIMPGYTHLQRAQPITFAYWCLAYLEMFKRDELRLKDALYRLDQNPLGSGALAGTAWEINREFLSVQLGFRTATKNALDSVSDRDYVMELLSVASISMIHLSRFSEDLIFFNSGEVDFIELSDSITSGSSLMPQKKNPDALELIRAKCGKVCGNLISSMMLLKGLPLSYNKDMQEDKKSLFETIEIWNDCLKMSILVLKNISINVKNCKNSAQKGYTNSTEIADYLVKKGIPFRDAHHITGKIILYASKSNLSLEQIQLNTFKKYSNFIEKDIYEHISLESSLKKRNSLGGVSFSKVSEMIKLEKNVLNM
ncbi:argininosuccinate lyase [Buchnera aphidicola (Mindarus keteleerifoliae)]|uniref:argininosuccinate lyase n=1 Tax=Buchnera aphidicola TaxID=9 RepID=UPI0031B6E87A